MKQLLVVLAMLVVVVSLAHAAAEPPAKTAEGITFKPAADWRAVESTAFTLVKYEAGDADAKATITISKLGPNAGSVTANVNRWRAQVGLEPLDEAGVKAALKDAKAGGRAGYVVDVSSPPKAADHPPMRLIAVILPSDTDTVFVRISGAPATVEKERKAFDAFLGSLSFAAEK